MSEKIKAGINYIEDLVILTVTSRLVWKGRNIRWPESYFSLELFYLETKRENKASPSTLPENIHIQGQHP